MKVAIIDDGVGGAYKEKILQFVIKNNKVCKDTKYAMSSVKRHSEKCLDILLKYSKSLNKSDIYSIKVMEDYKIKANISDVLIALKWCLAQKISIINLSIGTTLYSDYYKFKPIVDEMYENGVIIIAANSNNYALTFPAYLEHVISVQCDKREMLNPGNFAYCENNLLNTNLIVGSHDHFFPELSLKRNNSYVTPYITSLIFNYVKENFNTDFDLIIEYLKKSAVKIGDCIKEDNIIFYEQNNPKCFIKIDDKIPKMDVVFLAEEIILSNYNVIILSEKKLDNNKFYCFSINDKFNSIEYLDSFVQTLNADLIIIFGETLNTIKYDGEISMASVDANDAICLNNYQETRISNNNREALAKCFFELFTE